VTDIAALVADNLAIWASATERRSGVGRGGGKRNSLYGIERLRALILDLAVRGRLVPQNPNDVNRPGFVGGSHFQIGWSRYEQNNEQILP
jgi:hypothetical protein